MDHDAVYELACSLNAAVDLASYHFDTEGVEGCNGVWAVANTADNSDDATARIKALLLGMLPPGISSTNETTDAWLRKRWDDHFVRVGFEFVP